LLCESSLLIIAEKNHDKIVLNGNGIIGLVAKLKLTSDPSDQRYILETFASLSKNEKKRYQIGDELFLCSLSIRLLLIVVIIMCYVVAVVVYFFLLSRPFLARQEIQELLIPFLTSPNEPLMNAAQTILNNLRYGRRLLVFFFPILFLLFVIFFELM
jgi:hypothetical protein